MYKYLCRCLYENIAGMCKVIYFKYLYRYICTDENLRITFGCKGACCCWRVIARFGVSNWKRITAATDTRSWR